MLQPSSEISVHSNRIIATKRSLSESSVDMHKSGRCKRTGMWPIDLCGKSEKNTTDTDCQNNSNKYTGGGKNHIISDAVDVGIRVILVIVFVKLETVHPFRRKIQMEELWLYKNPRMPDIVSPLQLLLSVTLTPFLVTILHLALTRDMRDFRAASWTWTFALGLNGLCTSMLKLTAGRPRPDFFYRCFPDGIMVLNNITAQTQNGTLDLFNCTGNLHDIVEGHKSFPSGHSSFAFVGFGFITFYIGAKLHAFNPRGRGQTWKLCITLAPLFIAALIAMSRTVDYHHHWQDALVGSVIGILVTYLVYRQYYPSIFARNCHRPFQRACINNSARYVGTTAYTRLPRNSYSAASDDCGDVDIAGENNTSTCDDDYEPSTRTEHCPLICDDKQGNKWI